MLNQTIDNNNNSINFSIDFGLIDQYFIEDDRPTFRTLLNKVTPETINWVQAMDMTITIENGLPTSDLNSFVYLL